MDRYSEFMSVGVKTFILCLVWDFIIWKLYTIYTFELLSSSIYGIPSIVLFDGILFGISYTHILKSWKISNIEENCRATLY